MKLASGNGWEPAFERALNSLTVWSFLPTGCTSPIPSSCMFSSGVIRKKAFLLSFVLCKKSTSYPIPTQFLSSETATIICLLVSFQIYSLHIEAAVSMGVPPAPPPNTPTHHCLYVPSFISNILRRSQPPHPTPIWRVSYFVSSFIRYFLKTCYVPDTLIIKYLLWWALFKLWETHSSYSALLVPSSPYPYGQLASMYGITL